MLLVFSLVVTLKDENGLASNSRNMLHLCLCHIEEIMPME